MELGFTGTCALEEPDLVHDGHDALVRLEGVRRAEEAPLDQLGVELGHADADPVAL